MRRTLGWLTAAAVSFASGCFALGWDYQAGAGAEGGAGGGGAGDSGSGGGGGAGGAGSQTATSTGAGTCPDIGATCDTGLPGVCADGVTFCEDGRVTCEQVIEPGALPEICNGLDDDCDGLLDATPDGPAAECPCLTGQLDGHAYLFCTDQRTWSDARDLCALYGYHLATIDAADENNWIFAYAVEGSGKDWFLGYTDAAREGTWVWEDGTPQGYEQWDAGDPSGGTLEDCASMPGGKNGRWIDVACGAMKPFVCEAP